MLIPRVAGISIAILLAVSQANHARAASASADLLSDSSLPWHEQLVDQGRLSGGFGHGQFPSLGQNTHPGVDIGGGCGLTVKAADNGKVVTVVTEHHPLFAALGNAVRVRHAPSSNRATYTLYLHMQQTPEVSEGQAVDRGQTLGLTGETGAADGCHLHFEVRHFDQILHPNFIIRGRQNIYGPGDQREASSFVDGWSDPGAWMEGPWINYDTPQLSLSVGEERGGFSFESNGVAIFDGQVIFGAWQPGNAADFKLHVFPSPTSGSALVFFWHQDFGAMRVALIDLITPRVLKGDLTAMSRWGPGSRIAWSKRGTYAAAYFPVSEGNTRLAIFETATGRFGLHNPALRDPGDNAAAIPDSLSFITGDELAVTYNHYRLDQHGTPAAETSIVSRVSISDLLRQ